MIAALAQGANTGCLLLKNIVAISMSIDFDETGMVISISFSIAKSRSSVILSSLMSTQLTRLFNVLQPGANNMSCFSDIFFANE